ncbi:MAG TPA: acetyl-CoA carboxylase biotin carboxyl carrier protein [Flavisolibacter sp.]|jgi:acetyl-CoA carboxylase biotin carboxyl carrier protein|nr:acetyl-CoA carboxylase biotin carboxyl carrier protein [Flavisolibacter sp.]
MDFKQIQELINLVNNSNLGEVTIEQKDFRLTIKQKEENVTQVMAPAMPMQQQQPAQQPIQSQSSPSTAAGSSQASAESSASTTSTSSNLITIKSPMIGTFYRRPSPDKPNFVEIGDEVSTGKVVCIIEAMKLFNEIESEVSGKVVKILVQDSSPVEYDQPLYLVEPA